MPTNPEFSRRAREARRRYALAHDSELTFTEIGERVAARMRREAAFSHQAVRRWFNEGQEPESFDAAAALADVLGVEAAWLMVGRGAMQPRTGSEAPPATDTALPQGAQDVLRQYPPMPRQAPAAAPQRKRKA